MSPVELGAKQASSSRQARDHAVPVDHQRRGSSESEPMTVTSVSPPQQERSVEPEAKVTGVPSFMATPTTLSQPQMTSESSSATRNDTPASPFLYSPKAPANLGNEAENIAVARFLSACVTGSNFEYLQGLYVVSPGDGPLVVCVRAISLASFARGLQSSELLQRARYLHVQALAKTNHALQSSQDAKSDGTLASVLLLSLFETMFLEAPLSTDSWTAHSKGALALLKLRGPQQLQSRVGQQLWLQASSNIRCNCIRRASSVPDELKELDVWASHCEELRHNPLNRLFPITDALASMKAAISRGELSHPECIEWAMKIDAMAISLSNTLPPGYEARVLPASYFSAPAYGRVVYAHIDQQATKVWNSLRMTRLLMSEVIYSETQSVVDQIGHPSSSAPDGWHQIRESAGTVVKTKAEEICASVPQILTSVSTMPPGSPIAVSVVNSVLWPLSVAGRSSLIPDSVRQYIANSLRLLADKARFPKAAAVAQILEEPHRQLDWYVECHFHPGCSLIFHAPQEANVPAGLIP